MHGVKHCSGSSGSVEAGVQQLSSQSFRDQILNIFVHENSIIYQLKHGIRSIYVLCFIEFHIFTSSNIENKINPKYNTIQKKIEFQ